MVNSKFGGTNGLTVKVALKRVEEVFNKYSLNDTEDALANEALDFLRNMEQNFQEEKKMLEKDANYYRLVKDKLSNKQAVGILDALELN